MASTIRVDTLQDSGGNNLLVSNGSGSLTTNNIGKGKIGQVVVSSTTSNISTSSTSLTASGFTASITPSATTSKVLVITQLQKLILMLNIGIQM